MNSLVKALQTLDTVTENNMPTNSSSLSAVLDLFFRMGASRNLSEQQLIADFSRAFGENPELTLKAIFYNRDIRGGQGERRSFRIFYTFLCKNYPEVAIKNIPNVVEFGRFDDLYICAFETPVWNFALDFYLAQLKAGNKLAGKWLPRENKAGNKYFKAFIKTWGLHPKLYRKLAAGNTEVVETLMCQNQWETIDYNHVPSKAISLYRKAYYKHDLERFSAWIESLKNPESGNKIHAGAIFPHDVIRSYMAGASKDNMIEEQWKALPDFVPENVNFITVNDVSGSMSGDPLNICVALGIYLAERNKGPFKNAFITFSHNPELQVLTGRDVYSNVSQLKRANWEMNTNLEAVFRLILNQGKKFNVPESDMPQNILIMSDMQFDQCIVKPSDSGYSMIERMYNEAGYRLPNLIFWNLRTSTGIPVQYDQKGTALISGYSPSVLKNLFSGELNPLSSMLRILNDERYNKVTL